MAGCITPPTFSTPPAAAWARHRKMHLFDIDVPGGQSFRESATLSPGSDVTVFDTPGAKWACASASTSASGAGPPDGSPARKFFSSPPPFNMTTGPAHWELLFRQRRGHPVLHRGHVPPPVMNRLLRGLGTPHRLRPWGAVLHTAVTGREAAVTELDLSRVDAVRRQLPSSPPAAPMSTPSAPPQHE